MQPPSEDSFYPWYPGNYQIPSSDCNDLNQRYATISTGIANSNMNPQLYPLHPSSLSSFNTGTIRHDEEGKERSKRGAGNHISIGAKATAREEVFGTNNTSAIYGNRSNSNYYSNYNSASSHHHWNNSPSIRVAYPVTSSSYDSVQQYQPVSSLSSFLQEASMNTRGNADGANSEDGNTASTSNIYHYGGHAISQNYPAAPHQLNDSDYAAFLRNRHLSNLSSTKSRMDGSPLAGGFSSSSCIRFIDAHNHHRSYSSTEDKKEGRVQGRPSSSTSSSKNYRTNRDEEVNLQSTPVDASPTSSFTRHDVVSVSRRFSTPADKDHPMTPPTANSTSANTTSQASSSFTQRSRQEGLLKAKGTQKVMRKEMSNAIIASIQKQSKNAPNNTHPWFVCQRCNKAAFQSVEDLTDHDETTCAASFTSDEDDAELRLHVPPPPVTSARQENDVNQVTSSSNTTKSRGSQPLTPPQQQKQNQRSMTNDSSQRDVGADSGNTNNNSASCDDTFHQDYHLSPTLSSSLQNGNSDKEEGKGRKKNDRDNKQANNCYKDNRDKSESKQFYVPDPPSPSPQSISFCLPTDKHHITPLHCFVRKYCIELFVANEIDVHAPTKGKRRKVNTGQIGIRCLHCHRGQNRADGSSVQQNGSVYYPANIPSIYNATMNLLQRHLNGCGNVPIEVKRRYAELKGDDARSATSKKYWSNSAKSLGLIDTPDGMRISDDDLRSSPHHLLNDGKVHDLDGNVETNSCDKNNDDKGLPVVFPEDQKSSTKFSFYLLSLVRSCTFTEADRLGKRKNLPFGFAGIACKFCYGGFGSGRFFPASVKTMSDTSKTLNALHTHMTRCRNCPEQVVTKLERLRLDHDFERASMRFGSQRSFCQTIWERLHKDTDVRVQITRDVKDSSSHQEQIATVVSTCTNTSGSSSSSTSLTNRSRDTYDKYTRAKSNVVPSSLEDIISDSEEEDNAPPCTDESKLSSKANTARSTPKRRFDEEDEQQENASNKKQKMVEL